MEVNQEPNHTSRSFKVNALPFDENEMYGCQIICCNKSTRRRPISCMQKINNAKGALVFLCVALFMEGLINAGLFNAVISTIEKRFQLQSTESGLIASCFDISTCAALLVIAFSGERIFKPMWFGWGTFIMGVGCVLYAMPHFTAPSHTSQDDNISLLCGMNFTNSRCSGASIRDYKYFFMVANGLIGLGSTPLFTTAITYLDENVKQTNSAFYGGIYYSMGALGPAVGYLLGSALVSVYTDVSKSVDIPTTSSMWIGAWWIGFLVVGIICIISSFFILMFPRNLPGTSRFRSNRDTEVHRNKNNARATKNASFGSSWKDAPHIVLLLAKNIPYVSVTLSSCINYAFVYGFNTFGAKYIASVFGISISTSSLIFGVASIIAAAGGHLLGGYIVTKFKLTVRGILKFMIVCTTVCLASTFGFVLHCPGRVFSGPSSEDVMSGVPVSSCKFNCSCSSDAFKPVCGEDGTSYFSACFAGCKTQLNDTYFSDCSCVDNTLGNQALRSGLSLGIARAEECAPDNCNLLIPCIAVLIVAFLTTFMKTTPNLQATIRCIPFKLRTTGVSLQRLIFTLFGTIPGRIATGKVLDVACISWGSECGEIGACRAYNIADASKYMTIFLACQMAVCLILQVITYVIYDPSYEHDESASPEKSKIDENLNVTENINFRENESSAKTSERLTSETQTIAVYSPGLCKDFDLPETS